MNEAMSPGEAPAANLPASVDAVVCGGGPAGSTFATCLARKGWSVLLFERERFPRFHVGESLLPWNVPLFERIGVLGKIEAASMQVKFGARFYHQGSERTRFVKFARGIDGGSPSAFQVKRADFDHLLLRHAAESGADVREQAHVEAALEDEGGRITGVRVRLADADGAAVTREVRAKVVVDATGRDAFLARRTAGGRRRDPLLDRSAAFAHFDGFRRAEGPEGGDIVIVTTPDGWWWVIPFSDGSVSVGIVMPSARFKSRTGTIEEMYEAAIAGTPEVRTLLDGYRRTTTVHTIADYSYKSGRLAGDGFCLIGDSAAFLDPVFSTGVLLAMTSGELAADTVDRSLRSKGRVDGGDFRHFEKTYTRGIDRFTRFVHGFYSPAFLETFYTEAPHPLMEGAVTTVLGGGVFSPSLRARMWIFLFHASVVWLGVLQRLRGKGAFARATGLVVPVVDERDAA